MLQCNVFWYNIITYHKKQIFLHITLNWGLVYFTSNNINACNLTWSHNKKEYFLLISLFDYLCLHYYHFTTAVADCCQLYLLSQNNHLRTLKNIVISPTFLQNTICNVKLELILITITLAWCFAGPYFPYPTLTTIQMFNSCNSAITLVLYKLCTV